MYTIYRIFCEYYLSNELESPSSPGSKFLLVRIRLQLLAQKVLAQMSSSSNRKEFDYHSKTTTTLHHFPFYLPTPFLDLSLVDVKRRVSHLTLGGGGGWEVIVRNYSLLSFI